MTVRRRKKKAIIKTEIARVDRMMKTSSNVLNSFASFFLVFFFSPYLSSRKKLDEAKELQKFRKRPIGVRYSNCGGD